MFAMLAATVLLSMVVISNAQTTTCNSPCKCAAGKYVITSTTKTYEDCLDHFSSSATTGIYTINPGGNGAFDVMCDFDTAGGPWTVFNRRTQAGINVDFKRDWTQYANGFWGTDNNHWLGNDKIRRLVQLGSTSMRISMPSGKYAKYNYFSIGPASDNYRLSISGFSGYNSGDSLNYHNSRPFSTHDRDNDAWPYNCASYAWSGAWWNGACWNSNLLGWSGTYGDTYRRYFSGANSWTQMALKIQRSPSAPLTTCEPCPVGTYQNTNTFTGTSCTGCAAGKFSATTQSSACNDCYSGQIQPGKLSEL